MAIGAASFFVQSWSTWSHRAGALVFVLLLAVLGCGAPDRDTPLLTGVQRRSPPLSPEAPGPNSIQVSYVLNAPARLDASLERADGRSWPIYVGASRPVAGEYVLGLDGTVPGPGANERQALPDGDYTLVLEARGATSYGRSTARVPIRGADTSRPNIDELAVLPATLSPNGDGVDDLVVVAYRLAKQARVTVFADRVLDDGQRTRAWTGEQRVLDPGEQRARWDGLVADQPVADGAYEVGVRARDLAGNVAEARMPLTVAAGGVAAARLVEARITPRQLIRGGQVCLDYTVRNTGATTLRTRPPDPGYVYNSFDTYSSIADHAYVEQPGVWRVGLDWSDSPDAARARYPFRWGLGRDLEPGGEASGRGCVQLLDQRPRMVFFSGLVQETVAIHDNGAGMAEVRLTP